ESKVGRPERSVNLIRRNMQKAKGFPLACRQRRPVSARVFQQGERPADIGSNEIVRPQNRPVDVALSGKVNDGARPVIPQAFPDNLAVGNVTMHEGVTWIRGDPLKIAQISSVGQLVQIYDWTGFPLHPLQDEIRSD